MGILRRIGELIRMFFSIFVDNAEDSIPVERRLAYDRQKRAENLKKQMGAAEDVGAAAELMVQQLAEARVIAANVRQQAKSYLQAASNAAAKGDTAAQQEAEANAASAANELAESEADVSMLEQMVEEALSDKKESIAMVLDQAKELEKMARGDSRMVAKVRMTDMRRQQLELREQMMELVPGDASNVRQKIQERAVKDEARFKARKDVIDAMWEQKRHVTLESKAQMSAAGAAKLEELKREMGLATEVAAPAAPAPAKAEEEAMSASGGGGAGVA